MKATKRRFEQFLFYDYKAIEAHLARMAKKGWQIHKVTPFYWEYRRIEPQNLTYAVTYFSEASEFNPYPTDNQQTFHEYCKEAGWNLVSQWAQMQIFCTDRENPTPIETDESVKLNAIHRAMKKNSLPSSVFILLLAALQVFFQLQMITADPVYQLAMGSSLFVALIWSVLFIEMLVPLIGYIIWYRQSKKAIDTGGTCIESSSGNKILYYLLKALTGIIIVLSVLFIATQRFGWLVFFGIANITILLTVVFAIKKALKRAAVSRKVNITVTLVSCVILSFALTGAMTWGIVRGINAGWFGNKPAETYTTTQPYGSHTWDIYLDTLPLKVEDLQDVDYDHYSYRWTENESFLLTLSVATQNAFPDGQHVPELNYAIVDVKQPALFDICLKEYLNQYDDWRDLDNEKRYFRQTDDAAWQADAVYQLYIQDQAKDQYILCWGNRIVYINFDAIPTAEQIAITIEKLRQ